MFDNILENSSLFTYERYPNHLVKKKNTNFLKDGKNFCFLIIDVFHRYLIIVIINSILFVFVYKGCALICHIKSLIHNKQNSSYIKLDPRQLMAHST